MKPRICIGIVSCVLLVGCSGNVPPSPASPLNTEKPSGSLVPPKSTLTETPTSSPHPTETPTPVPSPTIPAPTITWVVPAVQTLDAETINKLAVIPSGLEECFPPCWNGLTPGESPPSDIPGFYAQFGIDYTERYISPDEIDTNLMEISANLYDYGTDVQDIALKWDERIEVIHLLYYGYFDIYGEAFYLHPKTMFEHLGSPDAAKIYIYKDWGWKIGLDFFDHNTALSYSAEIIRAPSGEPLLCIENDKGEVYVEVVFFSESYHPQDWLFDTDYFDDQEIYTDLTLPEFIAELAIPGKCIPVQIPDN